MSQGCLLAFNIVFALVFGVLGAYYLTLTYGGPDWFYFLTHWSFFTEIVFLILLPFATNLATQAKPNDPQPGFVSFLNVLLHIQLPLSLIVTVLYWTLVYDLGNSCVLGGADSETCEPLPESMTIFVHGVDFALCTLSFFASRLPFEFENAGWLLMLYPAYLIWSVIHYLLNLGDGWPLYSALDWSNPTLALTVAAGCLVVFTLGSVLYRGLAKLREALDECVNGPMVGHHNSLPLVMA